MRKEGKKIVNISTQAVLPRLIFKVYPKNYILYGDAMQKSDCLFCKIVRGEIPCAKLYEDEHVFSFLDIGPLNFGHALVVPKVHCKNLFDFPLEHAQALIMALQKVGRAVMQGAGATGLNVVQNNFADAGQSVFHMHWHLIPRHAGDGVLPWSPKSYASQEDMAGLANRIIENLSI